MSSTFGGHIQKPLTLPEQLERRLEAIRWAIDKAYQNGVVISELTVTDLECPNVVIQGPAGPVEVKRK